MIVKDGKVVKVLIYMLNQYGEFGFKLFKNCQISFVPKFWLHIFVKKLIVNFKNGHFKTKELCFFCQEFHVWICVRFFPHKRLCRPSHQFCLELKQKAKLQSISWLYLKTKLLQKQQHDLSGTVPYYFQLWGNHLIVLWLISLSCKIRLLIKSSAWGYKFS